MNAGRLPVRSAAAAAANAIIPPYSTGRRSVIRISMQRHERVIIIIIVTTTTTTGIIIAITIPSTFALAAARGCSLRRLKDTGEAHDSNNRQKIKPAGPIISKSDSGVDLS